VTSSLSVFQAEIKKLRYW